MYAKTIEQESKSRLLHSLDDDIRNHEIELERLRSIAQMKMCQILESHKEREHRLNTDLQELREVLETRDTEIVELKDSTKRLKQICEQEATKREEAVKNAELEIQRIRNENDKRIEDQATFLKLDFDTKLTNTIKMISLDFLAQAKEKETEIHTRHAVALESARMDVENRQKEVISKLNNDLENLNDKYKHAVDSSDQLQKKLESQHAMFDIQLNSLESNVRQQTIETLTKEWKLYVEEVNNKSLEKELEIITLGINQNTERQRSDQLKKEIEALSSQAVALISTLDEAKAEIQHLEVERHADRVQYLNNIKKLEDGLKFVRCESAEKEKRLTQDKQVLQQRLDVAEEKVASLERKQEVMQEHILKFFDEADSAKRSLEVSLETERKARVDDKTSYALTINKLILKCKKSKAACERLAHELESVKSAKNDLDLKVAKYESDTKSKLQTETHLSSGERNEYEKKIKKFKGQCRSIIAKYQRDKEAEIISRRKAEAQLKSFEKKRLNYRSELKLLKQQIACFEEAKANVVVRDSPKVVNESLNYQDICSMMRTEADMDCFEYVMNDKNMEKSDGISYPISNNKVSRTDDSIPNLPKENTCAVIQGRKDYGTKRFRQLSESFSSGSQSSTATHNQNRVKNTENQIRELSSESEALQSDRDRLLALSNKLRADLHRALVANTCSSSILPVPPLVFDKCVSCDIKDPILMIRSGPCEAKIPVEAKSSDRETESQRKILNHIKHTKLPVPPRFHNWLVDKNDADE